MTDGLEQAFNYKIDQIKKYPAVYRRIVLAARRAAAAQETEEVNEVGLHCREILIDYARAVYNPDFSQQPVQEANFKSMMHDTINHYSDQGRLRSAVSSIVEMANKIFDFTNQLTHSYSSTPIEAKICIELCSAVILSIETLIMKEAESHDGFYRYFGVLKCPKCRSAKLDGRSHTDYEHDRLYLIISCTECGWSDWTEG